MIIKIGNEILLEWTYILYEDQWVRFGDNSSIKLRYQKLFPRWYPEFSGSLYFLEEKFEEFGVISNCKHKHHEIAQRQIDNFLIRMSKLAYFI